MTFIHHVEQMYGVPYGYTKEWDNQVYSSGKISNERFFAFVRYLDAGIDYNFMKMQNLLLKRGLAKTSPLGLGAVWAVSARDVFDIGIEQLKKDPFFFLDQTPTTQPWKK
jgi:aminoglycoside N3'-acetyltransferase